MLGAVKVWNEDSGDLAGREAGELCVYRGLGAEGRGGKGTI